MNGMVFLDWNMGSSINAGDALALFVPCLSESIIRRFDYASNMVSLL